LGDFFYSHNDTFLRLEIHFVLKKMNPSRKFHKLNGKMLKRKKLTREMNLVSVHIVGKIQKNEWIFNTTHPNYIVHKIKKMNDIKL
jgi:hypothetical protein